MSNPLCPACYSTSDHLPDLASINDPLICTWCGRGPFVWMLTHLNKCAVAKQKGDEADSALQELKRQGMLIPAEPAWKQRQLDLVKV